MNRKLVEFAKNQQFDQKRRKYSNKHFFQEHKTHASVNDNEDVERFERGVLTELEIHKKNYDLVQDDIEEIERAIGKFEIVLFKVISMYSNNNSLMT